MTLQGVCQNTLTINNRAIVVLSGQDTMICMSYKDARYILEDVTTCKYIDSLLNTYMLNDSLKSDIIKLLTEQINILNLKNHNNQKIIINLEDILNRKDQEISIHQQTIKKQKKELIKQKILKKIGFIGSVALPILTIIVLTK